MNLAAMTGDERFRWLAASGKMTQQTLNPFGSVLSDMLGPEIFRSILIVDASGVERIDSCGVSWLLTNHKRFREAGGKMIVYGVPQVSLNALKVLRMDQVLYLAADAKGAIQLAEKDE